MFSALTAVDSPVYVSTCSKDDTDLVVLAVFNTTP